jgi:OOP family OmpA-OmpF porin
MKYIASAACAALLLAIAQPSFADSKDAAYDQYANPVTDSHGNCVRTKWQDANDPCAPPPPPPAPKPIAKPAPTPAPLPIVSLEQRTIYFDFDSSDLTSDSLNKLSEISTIINRSDAIKDVHVHGYTDQFGSDTYNMKLATERAAAVERYLDRNSRLDTRVAEVRGLGKAKPEDECQAMKNRTKRIGCMASQRRVEIEFKAQRMPR